MSQKSKHFASLLDQRSNEMQERMRIQREARLAKEVIDLQAKQQCRMVMEQVTKNTIDTKRKHSSNKVSKGKLVNVAARVYAMGGTVGGYITRHRLFDAVVKNLLFKSHNGISLELYAPDGTLCNNPSALVRHLNKMGYRAGDRNADTGHTTRDAINNVVGGWTVYPFIYLDNGQSFADIIGNTNDYQL